MSSFLNLDYISLKALVSLLVFVAIILVLKISFYKLEFFIHKLVSKTDTEIDDKILKEVKGPLFYLIVFLVALFELKFFQNKFIGIATNIIKSLITLTLAVIVYRILNLFIDEWSRRISKGESYSRRQEFLHLISFIKSLVKISVLTIAFFQVMSIWNVNVTPLLASAGIAGLAVALAAQQILSNFFGGVNLFLDKTLKVGDRIRFNGKYLIVDEVNIRTTKFRTLENTYYIVPNSILANSEIENLSEPEEPKNVRIKIGVAYGSDVDKVKKILKEVAENNSYCLKDKGIDVYFYELGDYSLNFLVVFRVEDASKMWPAQVEYVEKVYKRLTEEGIEIPFPTQTIYCKKE